jgi:hypothetical protein
MAKRPVFFVRASRGRTTVYDLDIDFTWYAGFAISQQQKSMDSLHKAFLREHPDASIIEISSRSRQAVGKSASAFLLHCDPRRIPGVSAPAVAEALADVSAVPVEVLFQASKVFDGGARLPDYRLAPREARKLAGEFNRTKRLAGFDLFGDSWPLEPKTLFYDWLYCHGLSQNPNIAEVLLRHDTFTDIAFNPAKSLNCQARSAALYVTMHRNETLDAALKDKATFTRVRQESYAK